MNNIDISSWKRFDFNEVFFFERGERYKTDDHIAGDTAYIASTKLNNGISGYVEPPEYMKVHKNAITLNNSGSVGYCFYHPYKFVCSDHCTVIDIIDKKQNLNIYIALFLKPIIEKVKTRYNFAREISNSRLGNETILLPVDKNKNPDWKFIENYIKNTADNIIYNNKQISHIKNSKKLLDTVNWKEFMFEELFEFEKGAEVIKDLSGGEIPLISATKFNNGFSGFYEDIKKIFNKNKITVASNGTVGKSFYQNYDFIATGDINVLSLKKHNLNKYIASFLCTIIDKEQFRFGYGRKWGVERMKQSKIKLPVDNKGNPDWQFMEDYIKSLPYSVNL